jgi:protein tyrosine phosphatase (PTP) superfamily phosphohydrolase (DUF442 family)
MPGSPPAVETEPRPKRRTAFRVVLTGSVAGLLLAAAAEAGRVLLGNNVHTLIPGRVYRSAQLSPADLRQLIRAHGIRTVVNLRGCCAPLPWYLEECRVTQELGVVQEDICFSAGRLPSVPEVRRLVEVLDRTAYPILVHCRRGADRTGLTSALILLLQTDATLDEGRRQLGLRYGHLALGRPAYLDQFLELYADWLRTTGREHSRAHFRRWLLREYCGGECRCRVEPLGFRARIRRNRPCALRVRMHNTGVKSWHLRPETNAGIHGRYVVWNDNDQQVASARAGLFDARVEPGGSIDLTLALPAFPKPGRYRLWVDMVDEQQCWFFQTGSEPLETELEVVE